MSTKPTYEELEQRVLELEQVEAALIASEKKFADIARSTGDWIWEIDAAGKYVFASGRIEQILGYIPEELIGKTPFEMMPEEEAKRVGKIFKSIAANKEAIVDLENWNLSKRGERVCLLTNGIPLINSSGDLTGYRGVDKDITERKRAEAELHHERDLLSRITETSPAAITFVNLEGQIIYANERAEKILGLSKEQIAQRHYNAPAWRITDYDGKPFPKEQLPFNRVSASTKPVYDVRHAIESQDGRRVFLSINAAPMLDHAGQMIGMVASVEDFTDRIKAEEELKTRNRFIETILANLPIGLGVNRISDNVVIYLNKKFEEIYGWPVEALTDVDTFFDKIYPGQKELKEKVVGDILSGDPSRMHWTDLTATGMDGGQRIISAMNIPLAEQDLMISTVQDTTERYNAEKQVTHSEEKFRQLAEMLPETIYEFDRTGKLTFANKSAFETFMYTEDDLKQGLNAVDMIAPQDRARAAENIFRIMEGNDIGAAEYMAIKKDGTAFPVMTRSSAIYSEDKVIGIRGIMIDMSEHRILEAQLRQAEKMQSIGTLAGGIAHDFNNILSIILGNTELAADDLPQWSPAQEYLAEIINASLRAKEFIKQLLSFSRKSEEAQKPILIPGIARESLRMLRSSIPANIEIIPNIQDDCFSIKADPTKIHQVLINLITNAAHAVQQLNGIIEVSVENVKICDRTLALINDLQPGDYVRLSVKDNGSGIAPQDMEKIFDPYFTTKEIGKGTGMGLAVVHGIVKSHNGSIMISSKAGQGTAIRIFFPICEDMAKTEKVQQSHFQTGTEKILIVDDELSVAKLSQRRLEKIGYTVAFSTEPLKALSLIRTDPAQFDLVISDMAMPKMTGDSLADEIRKINPGLPVILCTGNREMIDENMVKNVGIKAVLMKPTDMKLLADTVRKVLDEKSV